MQKADKIIIGTIAFLVVSGWIFVNRATHSYLPEGAFGTAGETLSHALGDDQLAFALEAENDSVENELEEIETQTVTQKSTPPKSSNQTEPVDLAIPASPTLYTDSLGDGWIHLPWETSDIRFDNLITITTQAPWGRLILHAQEGFSTSDYQSLLFNISSKDTSNKNLFLALNDESYTPIRYIRVNDYIQGETFNENVSYGVAIPLRDINPDNKRITEFVLESESPNTFTIDTISFSTNNRSTYTEKTTEDDDLPPLVSMTTNPVIFGDSFASGWKVSDTSWDAVATISDDEHYAGTASIRIDYQSAWGAITFEHAGGLDTQDKDFLVFGAHGGTNGNQQLDVIAFDTTGKELGRVAVLDGDRLLARSWKQVRIPLYRLNAEDTVIGSLTFQVNESTSFVYIDDILISN